MSTTEVNFATLVGSNNQPVQEITGDAPIATSPEYRHHFYTGVNPARPVAERRATEWMLQQKTPWYTTTTTTAV